ncbi:MAG: hypothetical protein V1859_09280 [archaeon]
MNFSLSFAQNSKKAQSSEFMGIILLVVILVVILLFSRLYSGGKIVSETQRTVEDSNSLFINTGTSKFQFVTEKGVSMNELMGTYSCYGDDISYYGPGIGYINIFSALRKTLNNYFMETKWKLEIDEKACLTSTDQTRVLGKCSPPTGKEYVSFEFFFSLPCRQEVGKGKIYVIK